MDLFYKGGQPIPKNVLEAMKYISKVGVITRPTWYHFFAQGNLQWKRDQLLNLVRRDVLKPHTCNSIGEAWVLTDWSINLLKTQGLSCVRPVPPQFIEHDEVVGRSLLILKRSGACQDWLTERELKMLNSQEFVVQKKEYEKKYPDAVFRMNHRKELWTFAVEYERTGKSSHRYRSILWQYADIQGISMVLYITEDNSIKKRIESALKFIGKKELTSRIVFIDALEWKRDPMTAEIKRLGKTISFKQLLAS